jgi:hypothetical protein
MAEIIKLDDRKRRPQRERYPTIKKIVDGEIIECVNIDALPSESLSKFLATE